MNNTVTYQITVQPWQIAKLLTLRLTRATYNRHGRQVWETLRQLEVEPDMLTDKLADFGAQLELLDLAWRAKVAGAPQPRKVPLSVWRETLGSSSGEQGNRSGDLTGTPDQGEPQEHDDETGGWLQ